MSRLIGNWVRNGYEAFEQWRNYSNSRKIADGYRLKIVESKVQRFADSKVIKRAKEESAERFGDPGHWHWLALYAELREEYVEGWLPGDLLTYKIIPYMNPRRLAYLSTFKSFDHRVFPGFASTPIGRIVNACYFIEGDEPVEERLFMDTVKQYGGEVVIKEDAAPSGEGIYFLSAGEIESITFQRERSYLIQPVFRQHPELAELYPGSVNTLRVSTYIGADGSISVKHKLLRVGSRGRRIVNAGADDIDIYIDEAGEMIHGPVDGFGRLLGDRHPDTGMQYRNVTVPSVPEALKACMQAHTLFPYLRFIAWDLYIDENAIPRMIEWNAVNPSIWVHEARIGPLWGGEEIGNWLMRNQGNSNKKFKMLGFKSE